MLLRCFLTVAFTTFYPLYQTFKGNTYIPIPPNRESIESIDMVLHIPIAANAFYEFLDMQEDDEASTFFAMYADMRVYDRACINNSP